MSASQAPLSPPPSETRKESYLPLVEFTLALAQAMLRSGYYSSEHPEAERWIRGLYGQFSSTIGDRSELSYLVTRTRDGGRRIAIEGYDAVPLSLHRVMAKGMADLFGPKILSFFDRWGLVSFSLRRECTQEEFDEFVALMSSAPGETFGAQGASEGLKQAFVQKKVLHVSTVFKNEIVGHGRRLSSRVEMAISRLRKDLSMLPLYEHASQEYLQHIKLQIIEDVIRPMRTPLLLKEFLVNYDLIAAGIEILDETQVEREVVANLSQPLLITIGRSISTEIEKLSAGAGGASVDDAASELTRRVYVLREITNRLARLGSGAERHFLDILVKQKAISIEDLPEDVRQALQAQKLADGFLEKEESLLQGLVSLPAGDSAREFCNLIARVFPILLQRRNHAVASRIRATVANRMLEGDPPLSLRELDARIKEGLSQQQAIKNLLEDLQHPDKERRDYVVDLVAAVEPPLTSGLIAVYKGTLDKAVRMSVFEALSLIGPAALQTFVTRVQQLEGDWSVIHHILTNLAQRGDPSLADAVAQLVYHGNYHVRQAALSTLRTLVGAAAEDHYLKALHDDEPAVRQTAVACLGGIKSCSAGALDYYAEVLGSDDRVGEGESEAVLIQVCRALAQLGEAPPETRERAEKILLDGLRLEKGVGLLAKIKKPHLKHSDRVELAICEALASVGSSEAILPLRELEATQSSALAARAAEVADGILQRSSPEQ